MRRVVSIIMATGLLLIPFAGLGQAQQVAPPVAQALVREGEFAFKLADSLKMGSPGSEVEAETALASAGIAPRNGWVADYPITPDIAGELETAITQAADSGRLALSRDEALMAFQGLIAEIGLSVVADTRGEVVQNEPPADYGQYSNPDVINNYYYNEGPPVVTYYPPPWDYSYMYAWVPYPFWCSGFWFSGFFMLNDFHRPIYGHGGPYFVSNHYRDHGSQRVHTVNPVTRHNGRNFTGEGDLSHGRGFRSSEARNGAASIYGRSYERSGHSNTPKGANSTRSGGGIEAGYSPHRGNSPPLSNSRTSGPERSSAAWGNRSEAAARTSGERPSSQQKFFGGPSRAPSTGGNGSFSSPSGGVSRPSTSSSLSGRSSSGSSVRAPSVSSNRSFSPPSGGVSRPSTSSSLSSRSSSGSSVRTPSMGGNRSFSPPLGGVSRPSTSPSLGSRSSSGSSVRAPSVGSNRSFSSPSGGVSRPSTSSSLGSRNSSGSSVRTPSMGGNRSFTAPSTSGRGSSGGSFRGF